jgi:hypothetical protein
VYSILNHGRVTHRPGLYKAWVSLQGYLLISSIKCYIGCLSVFCRRRHRSPHSQTPSSTPRPRRPSGGRHPGRPPCLPGGTGRFLRRPRLPAAGRAAGLASSRPGPLAPSACQPSATGSTPASRQPVAARGLGDAARREQSRGWCICPLAAGTGGGAIDSPDHPPSPTRGPGPGPHWSRRRTCRIPCCSRSHP